MRNEPEPKLSERDCDRKAMHYWKDAGKPEGQYPVYRKAVDRWNEGGAVEGEFYQCLKAVRDSILDEEHKLKEHQAKKERRFTNSSLWPWITSIVVPIGAAVSAVWVVLHEIRINRESLQITIEVQQEQNRQQVLEDYISQMTSLIAERDLETKYPKNEEGNYDPQGTQDPDAMAAISLTKTVLKLLDKKPNSINGNSLNIARGSLLVFLKENGLVQKDKPVIYLFGANLRRANLFGADLRDADLSDADLIGTNLSRANLFGADLSGAIVKGEWLGQDSFANFRDSKGLTDQQKADLKSRGALVDD